MKIAIPLAEGKLALHFGHSKEFVIMHLNGSEIQDKQILEPPPHEPGVLPKWLNDQGVDVVLAGGMGGRALSLFAEQGIKVLTGVPSLPAEEIVAQYLANNLQTGDNVCDH